MAGVTRKRERKETGGNDEENDDFDGSDGCFFAFRYYMNIP